MPGGSPLPASSSQAAANIAEAIQGAASIVEALGLSYFSDKELGLDRTRGIRYNLQQGWGDEVTKLLRKGHYAEAFYHLLYF